MRAGKLRHVVEYQEDASGGAVDALGQPAPDWQAVATYRAEVRGLTGREALQAQAVGATLSSVVVTRYVAEGTPGRPSALGRFRLAGGRTLPIVSVADPTGERRELRSYCNEDAAP